MTSSYCVHVYNLSVRPVINVGQIGIMTNWTVKLRNMTGMTDISNMTDMCIYTYVNRPYTAKFIPTQGCVKFAMI